MPAVPRQDAELAAKGQELWSAGLLTGYHCDYCHGADGAVGGKVPNLNRRPPTDLTMFKAVVQGGALAANGMPRFHEMSDADAQALFAYVINEAWRAHERDRDASAVPAKK